MIKQHNTTSTIVGVSGLWVDIGVNMKWDMTVDSNQLGLTFYKSNISKLYVSFLQIGVYLEDQNAVNCSSSSTSGTNATSGNTTGTNTTSGSTTTNTTTSTYTNETTTTPNITNTTHDNTTHPG